MRKALFFIPLFFSMLFFESCQNRHSEHLSTHKKSPLEMMVDDYVAKTFPNWLDSIRNEDDTLYLHVNFFITSKILSPLFGLQTALQQLMLLLMLVELKTIWYIPNTIFCHRHHRFHVCHLLQY